MRIRRRMLACMGVLLTLGCLYGAWRAQGTEAPRLPGSAGKRRVILRVWDVDGPTGSSAWLRAQCAAFEKALPGITVYLRSVPAEECLAPDAVLPDVVCFADGTFTAPEALLSPLSGMEAVEERFLQSGRWQGKQYALPLAAEGWVLAVREEYLPEPVHTPAPTSLLGRAAASPQPAEEALPPLDTLRRKPLPLAARGQGLFALCAWLGASPLALPEASMTQEAVLAALTRGEAAAALLTTGQWAKLEETTAREQRAAYQPWAPAEMLAPRMLYAGLTAGAQPEAAALLSYLISETAQRELAQRFLFSVRENLALYFASPWAELESAMGRGYPVNAFLPRERVENAARAVYLGAAELEVSFAELR